MGAVNDALDSAHSLPVHHRSELVRSGSGYQPGGGSAGGWYTPPRLVEHPYHFGFSATVGT